MRIFNTPSEAYLAVLADVVDNPEFIVSPRHQPVREKVDYQFEVVHPDSNPIVTLSPERNAAIADYTKKEFEVYNSRSRQVGDFANISSFWRHLENPDHTVNSAYGHLIFKKRDLGKPEFEMIRRFGAPVHAHEFMRTPWEWCVEALTKDKDTRQAVLPFSRVEHFWNGNADFTCTLHGLFLIRENKLSLSISMRSNDMCKGTVYDCVWFMDLMDRMVAELKGAYPELSKGSYRHSAHSLHVYERDMEKVNAMLGRK